MPFWTYDNLATWSGGRWRPAPPALPLSGVTNDTRVIQAGNLFVALRGTRADGHDFLGQAFAMGAGGALVACDARLPDPLPGPVLVVDDPLAALGRIAAGYRLTLSGTVVTGVSGSVGKTTVKELLASMLAAAWPTARSRGNWNNDLGLPLSLLAVEPTDRAAVLEVGISHPGEMAPLAGLLRPDWALISNIGPVHIEFFQNLEAIASEKAMLFEALTGRGAAVLDADGELAGALARRAPGRVVTISRQRVTADYFGTLPPRPGAPAGVTETASGECFKFRPPLPGDHHVTNTLLAIAAARGQGLAWSQIEAGLADFVAPPMRWQQLDVGGVMVINDAYNANPLSMAAALRTFADTPVAGQRWLMLGDMLELGVQAESSHAGIGRQAAAGPWAGLITLGPLAAQLAGAVRDAGARFPVLECTTHAAAARALAEHLHPGDAVLLKASRGMKLEEVLAAFKMVISKQ
ncbi:MAG: UDP-N-acetylmuramoyl-tripeptide--D-alanyl-D-alanine ligase [bacterium]